MRFVVHGKPETKGSTRAFVVKGRAVIVNDNPRAKAWQKLVTLAAQWGADTKLTGPVRIALRFQLAKPKSAKRAEPSVRPDLDKLVRCALDGMTGVVFDDDSQVVELKATKVYDSEEGLVVDVEAA